MRRIARDSMSAVGATVHDGGTVVVIQGPRFSTRAESAAYAASGFELLNMTQMPEAALCAEAGIGYVSVAVVTDYDVGLEGTPPVTHQEVLARFARAVRESPAVDARTGVSARFAIAAAETVAASALRRSGLLDEPEAVARIGDAASVTSTLRGKVEFESGEEGREVEVLSHLLRTATADTFRTRLAGLDLSSFVNLVAEGRVVETGTHEELLTAGGRYAELWAAWSDSRPGTTRPAEDDGA